MVEKCIWPPQFFNTSPSVEITDFIVPLAIRSLPNTSMPHRKLFYLLSHLADLDKLPMGATRSLTRFCHDLGHILTLFMLNPKPNPKVLLSGVKELQKWVETMYCMDQLNLTAVKISFLKSQAYLAQENLAFYKQKLDFFQHLLKLWPESKEQQYRQCFNSFPDKIPQILVGEPLLWAQ